MKRNPSIRIKATFLLIVFSLSTVVSFACAVGVNMGFNRDHHKIDTHDHHAQTSGATKHKHGDESYKQAKNSSKSHNHDVLTDHHVKQSAQTEDKANEDCCKDEAAKFEKIDKCSPQPVNYSFQPLFTTFGMDSIFRIENLINNLNTPGDKYFIRNHHPPIADTRIAIQSFLI